MKTERELYALELGGFGVIDAVFNDIDECIGFSCFSYCGLTKDDITFGYRIWLASKNREGYKLVPLEPNEAMLEALQVGFKPDYEGGSYDSHEGYKAMIKVIDNDH